MTKIMELVVRPELSAALFHFAVSCSAQREHHRLMVFGRGDDRGQFFPEELSRTLCQAWDLHKQHLEAGFKAKPRGVHMKTMEKLYDYVKDRDGTRYYNDRGFR